MIINPFGPYSFVSHGEIAIGGILSYAEPLDHFGFLMNVAREFTNEDDDGDGTIRGRLVHQVKLDDCDEVEEQAPEILRAVRLVGEARRTGVKVLVTCAAGRNRSALVAAEHLIQVGHNPQKVIQNIQMCRSNALTNEAFVQWLKRKR